VKRAIGYFRVSSVGQSGEHHVSLETQSQRCNSYCQTHNLTPIKTYTDIASGRRDDRKQYQSMLTFLAEKNADVVVVQFLDRFGRNPKEILRRIWALQDIGVEVVTTDEDIKEELVLLVRAGLAGAESKRTSERIKANISRAVSKGIHVGRVPYGFDGVKDIVDGRARITQFVPNPSEVSVIRQMFHLVTEQNFGYYRIAVKLNKEGITTKNGAMWEAPSVRVILKNESLKGTLVYGKRSRDHSDLITIDNFYPPILTKGEWDKLRSALASRRGMHGRTFVSGYLLSGIAHCGYCGGSLVGKTERREGRPYRRYRCRYNQDARRLCDHANAHLATLLDDAVLEELGKYADKNKTLEILKASRDKPEDRAGELERLKHDSMACEKEFQMHLRLLKEGRISDEQFTIANDPVKTRYEALLAAQKEIEQSKDRQRKMKSWHKELVNVLSTFAEDFKKLPLAQQKAKLMGVVKEIRVYKDQIEVYLRDVM